MVDKGHTVFIISWINPSAEHRNVDLEDYIKTGLLEAITVVQQLTLEAKVNLLGYCLGGMISAITSSYLQSKNIDCVNSLVLLTTLVDFSDTGDVSIFIDDPVLERMEKHMEEKGYLEGSAMFSTFSILKASEMLWYYYLNNYMLGKTPKAFDVLYWNADYTLLPFKMHKNYLRYFYQSNDLINGKYSVSESQIDISNISVPVYNLGAKEDHIAPWKSVYKTHTMYKKNPLSRFVLLNLATLR